MTRSTTTTAGARISTCSRALDVTAYRFSLEWSRIEPEEGEVSRASLDHYRRMVDGCRDRGLTPVVTLNHFTTPRWFHHDGSLDAAPKAGDRFARFTELVAAGRPRRRYVLTLNEPNLAACLPVLAAMADRGRARRRACRGPTSS